MTPQLERHLIELGVLPATDLESLQAVATTKSYPESNKNCFRDPRDENGNLPF